MCTFGDGISVESARRLAAAGLRRVQVPLHCGRQDAHDWLVGRPGALKAARRAIRAFVEAGVSVAAEVVVTRPTTPHLAETMEVLARIGVRSVVLRRVTQEDVSVPEFVFLSPRFDLLGASLEELEAVPGIGPVIAKSVADFFAEPRNRREIERLRAAGVRFAAGARAVRREGGPLAGKTFVLTGTLPGMSREEAKRLIEEAGGKVTGSVSSKTTALIVGDSPGASKTAKAESEGIPILDAATFHELLEKGLSVLT